MTFRAAGFLVALSAFVISLAPSAHAERLVTDQLGRQVRLPDVVSRAVVLQHQTLNLGQADLFLGYGSSAEPLRGDARFGIVELPAACAVMAEYGVGASTTAPEGARVLLSFICSPAARQILQSHGFQAHGPRQG